MNPGDYTPYEVVVTVLFFSLLCRQIISEFGRLNFKGKFLVCNTILTYSNVRPTSLHCVCDFNWAIGTINLVFRWLYILVYTIIYV